MPQQKKDCRKRVNKTLVECIERRKRKLAEKKLRKETGKRYAKSRKGVKQPKNRKRPVKKGSRPQGLSIAQQGFRQDVIAGRGQPPPKLTQPQGAWGGVNMGFGSPFGIGAVYNQLQTAQTREVQAQSKVKKIFKSNEALTQRLDAQQLQIENIRGGRRGGGLLALPPPPAFDDDDPRGDAPVNVRELPPSVEDVMDSEFDRDFQELNDDEVERKADQIRVLEVRRDAPAPLGGEAAGAVPLALQDPPNPNVLVDALRRRREAERAQTPALSPIRGSPLSGSFGLPLSSENRASSPPDPLRQFTPSPPSSPRVEPEENRYLAPPTPELSTTAQLNIQSPAVQGRDMTIPEDIAQDELLAELGRIQDDQLPALTPQGVEDLNRVVKRYNIKREGRPKVQIDFSYGGASKEHQKELFELASEEENTAQVDDLPDHLKAVSIHSLADKVRPIGSVLKGNVELRSDFIFGNKVGSTTTRKKVSQSKINSGAIPNVEGEFVAPQAVWEQVVMDRAGGGISRFHKYDKLEYFDRGPRANPKIDALYPLAEEGKVHPTRQLEASELFGRFVIPAGSGAFQEQLFEGGDQDEDLVYHPFKQKWDKKPEGFEGTFGQFNQIYHSSLNQDEVGMPQPFSTTNGGMNKEGRFTRFGNSDEEGNISKVILGGRGKERNTELEQEGLEDPADVE